MKIKLLFIVLFIVIGILHSQAQHVRVRPGFPVGISIGSPGPAPYAGAIWTGPEWQWLGGRYIYVPGYWVRPRHHGAIWVQGHWKYSRYGYRWVPGRWR